jgi:uncharacterized membrane protein YfcA
MVVALLALVSFVAGTVDAIAGGGGLLTVPALLAAGLPTHLTLGTNKGCSTFGTSMAAFTFARAGQLPLRSAAVGFASGAAGALFGARLQLAFSPAALRPIVLVLLVVVAVVLAIPRKPRAAKAEAAGDPSAAGPALLALVLGVYDGFFGPGTGTFLIAFGVALFGLTMSRATADAKAVNLGSNVASLVTFAWKGTVLWAIALPMAAANVAGGALGARLAMKGGDRTIRMMVIVVSLALVAKLAVDLVRR